jgi:hypothetical protein
MARKLLSSRLPPDGRFVRLCRVSAARFKRLPIPRTAQRPSPDISAIFGPANRRFRSPLCCYRVVFTRTRGRKPPGTLFKFNSAKNLVLLFRAPRQIWLPAVSAWRPAPDRSGFDLLFGGNGQSTELPCQRGLLLIGGKPIDVLPQLSIEQEEIGDSLSRYRRIPL